MVQRKVTYGNNIKMKFGLMVAIGLAKVALLANGLADLTFVANQITSQSQADVHLPGTSGFEKHRLVNNGLCNSIKPGLVVRPRTTKDVSMRSLSQQPNQDCLVLDVSERDVSTIELPDVLDWESVYGQVGIVTFAATWNMVREGSVFKAQKFQHLQTFFRLSPCWHETDEQGRDVVETGAWWAPSWPSLDSRSRVHLGSSAWQISPIKLHYGTWAVSHCWCWRLLAWRRGLHPWNHRENRQCLSSCLAIHDGWLWRVYSKSICTFLMKKVGILKTAGFRSTATTPPFLTQTPISRFKLYQTITNTRTCTQPSKRSDHPTESRQSSCTEYLKETKSMRLGFWFMSRLNKISTTWTELPWMADSI